jgi:hypothetical protein
MDLVSSTILTILTLSLSVDTAIEMETTSTGAATVR